MRTTVLIAFVTLVVAGCAGSPDLKPYQVAPWSGALVGADGRTVTALGPSGGCSGGVTAGVKENSRTVAYVLTDTPFNLSGPTSCRASEPVVRTVRLAAPLGDRSVVDFAGHRLATITADRLRVPGWLPAGYQPLQDVPAPYPPGAHVARQRAGGPLVWSRVYGPPTGYRDTEALLTGPLVISQAPQPIPTPYWQRAGSVTVAGHQATVYSSPPAGNPVGPAAGTPSEALCWSAGGWSVLVALIPQRYQPAARPAPSSSATALPPSTSGEVTDELARVAAGLR